MGRWGDGEMGRKLYILPLPCTPHSASSSLSPITNTQIMQIRRRSPSPAVNVSILRYQVALPDSAPNNILEEIVWHKETEIDQMREKLPLLELQKKVIDLPPT
ncbi:MAG TPA: hypothetical protein VK203_04890, partial [Nostocaceae cyanobacterium]|nr:hypothetical protein [Nostocaceae cyanobacterium]